jgi:hypothetical protein
MRERRATITTLSAALLFLSVPGGVAAQSPSPKPARFQSDAAAGKPNTLSAAERSAGWRLLFDGKTFTGWHGLGFPDVPTGLWVVEDGAIKHANGKGPVQADGQPLTHRHGSHLRQRISGLRAHVAVEDFPSRQQRAQV